MLCHPQSPSFGWAAQQAARNFIFVFADLHFAPQVMLAKRAGLYKSLLVRHLAVTTELAKARDQLQASQGMSIPGIDIPPWFYRHNVLASSDIVLISIFWLAAAARDQPAVDALTARVREIQGMTPMIPIFICASFLHLSYSNFLDITFPAEKDQLVQTLKDEEAARASYAGEVQKVRGEASGLRTELEQAREELKTQVDAAAQAKGSSEVTERRLRADITALREENEKLKKANEEQQRRAGIVEERNARWLELAKKANEKMEG